MQKSVQGGRQEVVVGRRAEIGGKKVHGLMELKAMGVCVKEEEAEGEVRMSAQEERSCRLRERLSGAER